MKVAFRADASLRIGTGHVMRCLTLAAELDRRGAECVFICRDLDGNLSQRIRDAGFACHLLHAPAGDFTATDGPAHAAWAGVPWHEDARQSAAILADSPPDWLVMDHYAFDARWEEAARPAGTRLMVIDDLADRAHAADIVLDQNLGRAASDYDGLVPEGCVRLIGPRHALLRPEFAATRAAALRARSSRPFGHLLISMGGVDGDDHTSRVLQALRQADLPPETRATVILGAGAPARVRVELLADAMPISCRVVSQVEAMHEAMADADLAIGAAGGTAWERCCLGLPAVVIPIAENQRPGAATLAKAGAAVVVENRQSDFASTLDRAVTALVDDAGRAEMSDRAAAVCDGDGVLRVARAICGGGLTFRPAGPEDSRRVWDWRRAGGADRFNTSGPDPDFPAHDRWFRAALGDGSRHIVIVENGGVPDGYLRFDRQDADRALISICLAGDARHAGLGRRTLGEAARLAAARGIRELDALIHPENEASIRSFQSAGYKPAGATEGFLRFTQETVQAA